MNISPPPFGSEFDFQWKTWFSQMYDWFSTADAWIAPNMTTTERDALTAKNGMIIYNTTTNAFNFYENGAWVTK